MAKVYISGPITGVDDYKEKFARVEEMYKAAGHYVLNPAKLSDLLPEDCTTWKQYMDFAIELLKMSSIVVMLPGWEKSKGACVEYYLARELDKMIIEEVM